MLRRQLPVYSPLPFATVAAAAGSLLSDGAPIRLELERELRQLFSADAVVLTDSGTSALGLALRAAAQPSRPVALPAYGCYDLATAADSAAVDVLLYDVDPATLAPDLASLGRALQAGAGTVVIASLFGYPIGLEPLTSMVTAVGGTIVEDAAQAIGMTWRGIGAGHSGSFGVLSFGRGKGVTGGGGGALLFKDPAAKSKYDRLNIGALASSLGVKQLLGLSAQWTLARPSIYGALTALPLGLGETFYHPAWQPCGASTASAGAVLRSLPLHVAELHCRRRNAARLVRSAGASRWSVVMPVPDGDPAYLRLPLRSTIGAGPETAARGASLGVMPGYPLALCDLGGFSARVLNGADDFPGARALAAGLVTLPTHSLLTESDLSRLERWLADSA